MVNIKVKAWGHGGLCYILLQELKGQTGKIMADKVMCLLPFSPPLPTCQYSPWGLFPQKKQCGRCSQRCSSDCCDLQGSKHQAGQVAALNWAPPTPVQVPLASGAARKGGSYLRLKRRRNKCRLQKEKPERISLILKAGEAFLASRVFQW